MNTTWRKLDESAQRVGYRWMLEKTFRLPEFRVHLRSGRLTNVDCAYMGLEYLSLL